MDSPIFKSSSTQPIYPGGISLPAFLRSNLSEKFYDNVHQICADSGVEYTFKEVIDLDLRFASALKDEQLGLQYGSRVAVILPTVPEYLAIVLGVLDAGMTTVHFNPNYSETEMTPLLEQLSISAAICTPSGYDRLKDVLAKFGIKAVITVGGNDLGIPNYFDLVRSYEPMTDFCSVDEHETAMIFFSSGTTGVPKGAALSHKNLISLIICTRPCANYCEYGAETHFAPFNAFHAAGIWLDLWTFDNKWRNITIQERISKAKYEAIIKELKPSILWMNASVLSMLCSLTNLTESDFGLVKKILFGGGNIDDVLVKRLRAKVGNAVSFMSGYGSTETCSISSCSPLHEGELHGKVHNGKLLAGLEMKIVDPESGKMLGKNQSGELCFRGPMLFNGYVNNEKANEVSLKDGWFQTGDIGYIDENGLIYIVARIKEIIRVHGYQVAPMEIENVIKKHELVDQAIVFGVPDQKSQEAPRALIVPRSDTLTEDDIHEFLKDKLVHYKQLKGGIRFVKSLPTTPGVDKLSRKAAKEMDAAMAKEELMTEN